MGKHRRILIRGVTLSDLHFFIVLSYRHLKKKQQQKRNKQSNPQNSRCRKDNISIPHPLPPWRPPPFAGRRVTWLYSRAEIGEWENSVQIGLVDTILILLRLSHIVWFLFHNCLSLFSTIEKCLNFATFLGLFFISLGELPVSCKNLWEIMCILLSCESVSCLSFF